MGCSPTAGRFAQLPLPPLAGHRRCSRTRVDERLVDAEHRCAIEEHVVRPPDYAMPPDETSSGDPRPDPIHGEGNSAYRSSRHILTPTLAGELSTASTTTLHASGHREQGEQRRRTRPLQAAPATPPGGGAPYAAGHRRPTPAGADCTLLPMTGLAFTGGVRSIDAPSTTPMEEGLLPDHLLSPHGNDPPATTTLPHRHVGGLRRRRTTRWHRTPAPQADDPRVSSLVTMSRATVVHRCSAAAACGTIRAG